MNENNIINGVIYIYSDRNKFIYLLHQIKISRVTLCWGYYRIEISF